MQFSQNLTELLAKKQPVNVFVDQDHSVKTTVHNKEFTVASQADESENK